MPRKDNLIEMKEVKAFDNVNIRTTGKALYEGSRLWGNKTLCATKAFEGYLALRNYAGRVFSSMFTLDEVALLRIFLADIPLSLPISATIVSALEIADIQGEVKETLIDKVRELSEVEQYLLAMEITRMNYVRKFALWSDYNSFTELLKEKE